MTEAMSESICWQCVASGQNYVLITWRALFSPNLYVAYSLIVSADLRTQPLVVLASAGGILLKLTFVFFSLFFLLSLLIAFHPLSVYPGSEGVISAFYKVDGSKRIVLRNRRFVRRLYPSNPPASSPMPSLPQRRKPRRLPCRETWYTNITITV